MRSLIAGLLLSTVGLAIPATTDRFWLVIVHLTVIVGAGLWLALQIADLADQEWFAIRSMRGSPVASATAVTVVVTGWVALITLASSAAIRLPPSLQFLQLLSALDIAWSTTALVLGLRWLWSDRAARVGGVVLAVVCVLSIANYLRVVGFAADGGWLVDGRQLLRLVIPFDTAAAAMAIGSVLAGARRAGHDTEQRRPQS